MRQIWIPTFAPAPFQAGSLSADSFFTCINHTLSVIEAIPLDNVTDLPLRIRTEQRKVAVLPVVLLRLDKTCHFSTSPDAAQ